jgi:tetratricopeptide (TPR) repeat protein
MRSRLVAAVTVAALASGCAAGRAFRCPAQGGAPWRELATEHFVLRTDLDRDDALETLRRLERLHAAIRSALFEGAPGPGLVEVVAFRSAEEFRELAPAGVDAYYLRSSGSPPRIVLTGALAPSQRELLSHELTHHFLGAAFQRQPRWFAEGLAAYMESLGDQGGGADLVVGRAPPARLSRARWDPVPSREVLGWSGMPQPRAWALYASSWLLVHYLATRQPEAFAAFQRRLARGEDPDAAWRAELPALDPARPGALEALDRTLAAYARRDVEVSFRPAPPPAGIAPVEEPMPPVEVHALRLALWPQRADPAPAALRAEVAEALREDPHHPVALQVLAETERRDPEPLARTAVAAHPDDARAWTFLAGALAGSARAAEREAAYRRAAELAPDHAAALANLAGDLLDGGRSGEALPYARRAAALAPWSPPILHRYAAVLADLGRCAEAIPVQRRALEALPDGTSVGAFGEFRDRLAGYVEQCRVANAPAAAVSPAPKDRERAPEVLRERSDERDARAGAGMVEGQP